MTNKLERPPGICDECYANQTFHPADVGREAYYCRHNGVLAFPRPDFKGWFSESGVSEAEHNQRFESAARTLEVLAARANKMN